MSLIPRATRADLSQLLLLVRDNPQDLGRQTSPSKVLTITVESQWMESGPFCGVAPLFGAMKAALRDYKCEVAGWIENSRDHAPDGPEARFSLTCLDPALGVQMSVLYCWGIVLERQPDGSYLNQFPVLNRKMSTEPQLMNMNLTFDFADRRMARRRDREEKLTKGIEQFLSRLSAGMNLFLVYNPSCIEDHPLHYRIPREGADAKEVKKALKISDQRQTRGLRGEPILHWRFRPCGK